MSKSTQSPKKIIWKQETMPAEYVADYLTRANFQPGKFTVFNTFPGRVTIVYVEAEL